jgi:hypothetical protein
MNLYPSPDPTAGAEDGALHVDLKGERGREGGREGGFGRGMVWSVLK